MNYQETKKTKTKGQKKGMDTSQVPKGASILDLVCP